jgi:AraC-like DNA-binding protein
MAERSPGRSETAKSIAFRFPASGFDFAIPPGRLILQSSLKNGMSQVKPASREPGGALSALRDLLDMLPDVQAWIKDAQRRYLWVNRTFLLNYGMHQISEVLGKTDDDLSPSHLAAHFREGDEAVLAGQTVQARLELVGRFDHTAQWCFTTKRPVLDKRGRIIGTAGFTRALDAAQIDQRKDIRLGVVIALMTRRLGKSVTSTEMARAAGMSARAFERSFAREYGLPPQQYLKRLRIQTACRALVDTREPIADIGLRCGFADQSHLTREFRRVTGLTPGTYREKYAAAIVPRAGVSVLSSRRPKR